MGFLVLVYAPRAHQRETKLHEGPRNGPHRARAQDRPEPEGEEEPMGKHLDDLPLFLTPMELAQVTGEHVNSIRRGISEGRIPADKVNGRWRICRDKVFPNACAREGAEGGAAVSE